MVLNPEVASALEFITDLDAGKLVDYKSLSPLEAAARAKDVYDAWSLITIRDPSLLSAMHNLQDGDERARNLRRLGLVVGMDLVSALAAADSVLLPGSGKKDEWFPYLQSLRTDLKTSGVDQDSLTERSMLGTYLDCRWNIMFMHVVGSAAMGGTPVGWDMFIYWCIEDLNRIAASSGRMEHTALAVGMTAHLAASARIAVDKRDKGDFDRRDTALGLMAITQELPLLASRNSTMKDRYGAKNVESRFEQQLNILMQSLGYFTVPTTPGERRVDLVCISPGSSAGTGHTILVEAKSTSSSYSLPTADSRAIEEYALNSQISLSTMHPIKVILLVGPAPTVTVANKVRSLESKIGIPVRYCEAFLLARLRRALPGPVESTRLVENLIKGPFILTWDTFKPIVDADKMIREAHMNFVSTVLKA